MLAQSNSEFIEFLRLFDNDILGIALIVGTIGFFISFIVLVVSITRTWNNISTARLNQRMIHDLLAKGYTVEDVERLAHGHHAWKQKFSQLFQSAKDQLASLINRQPCQNTPAPPFKQSA